MLLDGGGIGGGNLLHPGEIFFDTGFFETGFGEILRSADEDARAALDGRAQGAEVATRFRCEKENGLFRVLRDGDRDAFGANVLFPGFDAGEPAIGWWVRGAAQEGNDEEVVNRLSRREVGVQPELVSRLQVRHGRNGERLAGAGDPDVDFGAGEIKAGGVWAGGRRREEKNKHQQQGARERRKRLKEAGKASATNRRVVFLWLVLQAVWFF